MRAAWELSRSRRGASGFLDGVEIGSQDVAGYPRHPFNLQYTLGRNTAPAPLRDRLRRNVQQRRKFALRVVFFDAEVDWLAHMDSQSTPLVYKRLLPVSWNHPSTNG